MRAAMGDCDLNGTKNGKRIGMVRSVLSGRTLPLSRAAAGSSKLYIERSGCQSIHRRGGAHCRVPTLARCLAETR